MKTNPELCAKVARVMGKSNVNIAVKSVGTETLCMIDAGQYRQGYTPDLPGADFCEVQAWALEKYGEVDIIYGKHGPEVSLIFPQGEMTAVADTIEQALCRAVAAM